MAQEHDLSGASEYHISSTMWIEYDWTAYARVTSHDMEVTDIAVKYPVLLHFDQLDAPVPLTEAQALVLAEAGSVDNSLAVALSHDAERLANGQAYDLYNEYAADRSDALYDEWRDRQMEKKDD